MKHIFYFFLMFSVSVFAQITIINSDMSNMFTIGYSTTVHEFDGSASIFIDSTGGGNVWDFTGLQGNLTYDLLSIDSSEAPYGSEFPGADIITYEKNNSGSGQFELWSYYSLDGSFGNLGNAGVSSQQPGDTVITKDSPARIEAQFPMTYNSSWSQTYNQNISVKGIQAGASSIDRNVVVDAYGTLLLPGGFSSQALRLRETTTVSTVAGDSTTVSYFFITKEGAQVTLTTNSSNPPAIGTINITNYSWNAPPQNNGGGGGTNVFYIQKPDSGDIVIAGEPTQIIYGGNKGKVNLYYSIDKGNHFALIDSDQTISSYYWKVPDSLLTTKAIIKGIDDSTGTLAYSGPFKIKPWQLTRLDTSGNFELFELGKDNWKWYNKASNMWPESWYSQFNYFSGTDTNTHLQYPPQFKIYKGSRFMDWPLFVNVFGKKACYWSTKIPIYKIEAILKWIGISDKKWEGSCFGFAISSLLGFYHPNGIIPFIGDYTNLNSQPLSDEVRLVINYYFTFQWGKKHRKYQRQHKKTAPRELLKELKETLSREDGDGRALSFFNNNGSGGHAVVPYKLKRINNTSNFKVLLYNSDFPKDIDNFIYLDSLANTWSDSTGLKWGTGSSNCFLRADSKEYLPQPALYKGGFNNLAKDENTSDTSRLTIYNASSADIIISSPIDEQIGYKDSTAFNDLTDAIALIPETGSFSPPIGYDVPENNYSIKMNNFLDSLSYTIFETDSTFYYYNRNDVEPDQSDLLSYNSDEIGIKNLDASNKNISLETVIEKDTVEDVFIINNLNIYQNDSINIGEQQRSNLLFKNYGSEKSYDLRIQRASAAGEFNFYHSSISLPVNSSQKIIPVWSGLDTNPVKILIDNGNDGTIDDSVFISNEITEVEGRYSSGIPNTFTLYQNYPNPFNPTTTIKYDLPTQSFVTLKVYNILGEEVATLVNGVKQAGSYNVVFNASSLASGVYIYELATDEFVSSKKMLIIK